MVHFPLHPDTPPEGLALADLFAGRDLGAMHARMKALMQAEGLAYGERTHTYNSRLAQEIGAWAETQPGGGAVHDALFTAYFADGRNLADRNVLVEAARSAGLPADRAGEVIDTREYAHAVDADWQRSRELGVTGVPTFVCGRHYAVGAQPYEVLERLVVDAGARPRPGKS